MSTVLLSDGRANHESFAPRRHRTTLSNIPAAHAGGYSNAGEPHKLVGLQSITTRTASQSERTFSKVKARNGKSHGISGFHIPNSKSPGCLGRCAKPSRRVIGQFRSRAHPPILPFALTFRVVRRHSGRFVIHSVRLPPASTPTPCPR